MVKLKMDAKDRLMVEKLFPQESDITVMMMVKDIRGKTSLSSEEMKGIDFKAVGAQYQWNGEKGEELVKEFEFSGAEMTFLKERVEDLHKTKKVTEVLLDLCIKVREGGKGEKGT